MGTSHIKSLAVILHHQNEFMPITVIRFFFCCKKYFRTQNKKKRTKIFYTNIIFYNEIFCALVGSWLHTSTSPIAAAHISLYTWQPLTQQAISSARCAISSINAHHTQLVKYFRSIWSVRKFFNANIFSTKIYQTKKSELWYQVKIYG